MRKPSKTRRTYLDIISAILKACCNGVVNKTRIVYSTNLNFKLTNGYLEPLIDKGYIIDDDNNYQISESGKELLAKLNEIQTLLKSSEK